MSESPIAGHELACLVLGTRNDHKVRELAELLPSDRFRLETLAAYPSALDVEETGQTFAENARLKATLQAKHLGCWVLAEDSGLVVDALGGRPGVYSARYAGSGATDADNNRKLLTDLQGIPPERRGAHYVCHAVVADRLGVVRSEAVGECHGRIRTERAGAGGFGYDPLFEVPEYHRTFGELGAEVKAAISHRARALRQLVPALLRLAASDDWRGE